MEREANFGGILQETAALVSDAGRAVLIYVIILTGMTVAGLLLGLETALSTGFFGFKFGFAVNSGAGIVTNLFKLFTAVVTFLAAYWLVTQFLLSRGLFRSGNRFWPYLGMTILMGLGLVAGFLLLIIPGFILMVRWSATAGYVVGARKGVTESLRASWEATRGHGWSIFFAGLVLVLGLTIALGIVGGITGIGGATFSVAVSSALQALFGSVTTAFGIAVYCLVHHGGEELQDVFA